MALPNIVYVAILALNLQTGEATVLRTPPMFKSMAECQAWLKPELEAIRAGLNATPVVATIVRDPAGVEHAALDAICMPEGNPA